jgi:hypothetical protein
MANIEEEYKKIYADTVNEWENESGDTLSSINNGIIDFENSYRYFL